MRSGLRVQSLWASGQGWLYLAIVTAFVASSESAAVFGADKVVAKHQPEKAVRELCESYIRNLNSFDRIVCRYELSKYFAPVDLEDIYRGRAKPGATATGLSVRRGSYRREQSEISDAEDADRLKTGRSHFGSSDILMNSTDYILVHRRVPSVNFWKLKPDSRVPDLGPFSLGGFSNFGVGSVDWIIKGGERIDRSRLIGSLNEEIAHAAVPAGELIGIECQFKADEDVYAWQFFLAPKQGCLPVVCRSLRNGKLRSSALITEIREIKGNRFFPMRSMHCQYDSKATGKIADVFESKVTMLEVDQPLAPSLFEIEVKPEATYMNLSDPNSQMRLPGPRKVGLNDLHELYRLGEESSKRRWADPKAMKFGPFPPSKEK